MVGHATVAAALGQLEDLPSPEDRREHLREMWLAMLDNRFPEWWVANCCSRLENAEEAAQYADLADEEWTEQKAEWAERYRKNGVDGDDDELAEAHVRNRYDVSLRTFRHLVVTWPDGRIGDELERAAASGVNAAKEGLERVNKELAADGAADQETTGGEGAEA